MQNDVLSDYKSMMNGYEKLTPATYTYQNSNNVSSSSRSNGGTKMQMKNSSAKNIRVSGIEIWQNIPKILQYYDKKKTLWFNFQMNSHIRSNNVILIRQNSKFLENGS